MKKVQQEMKEQMKKMMEMIKNLTKGKNSLDNPEMTNATTFLEGKKEEMVFPMMYTYPPGQTSQRTYPTMFPQSGGFSIIYPTAPMVQMTNAGQQASANMMDMLTVPDLDDPNKQEKLMMKENLEQIGRAHV